LGSLVVVQVLPWGLRLMRGAELQISVLRVAGLIVVIVGYMAAGGLVAYLVGDAIVARHAVAYGMGWQGLIGGFLQGQRADELEPPAAE
jgi:uncharacterized membrane protein YbjE (DUF340 family)